MKTKAFIIFLISAMMSFSSIFAQGFQRPSAGKAVIYFIRIQVTGVGSYEFFHQDKYIGVIKGRNYLRYECDPGNHLFWASSENKEFVTADLKEGGVYVVLIDLLPGMFKNHVGLEPIISSDKKFDRVKEEINSKPQTESSSEIIAARNKELESFISVQLEKYNDVWKNERNFRHISADMAIPEDVMK
jgi:hypothetical protein